MAPFDKASNFTPHINFIYKNDILPITLSTIEVIICRSPGPIKIVRPPGEGINKTPTQIYY